MPNIWTHLIYGQHVMQALGQKERINQPELKRLFNYGCQGPDFLFYHNFLPWKKGKIMNKLGSVMHSQHCGRVIMDLLDSASALPLKQPDKEKTVIYALGFVLHHVLDRNMHPYVFSRSGFRKWDHQRFEVMMDTLIVKQLLGIETWRTPVWHEIDIGKEFPASIVEALEQITACHYPELAESIGPEDWNQACRDMISAQRLFHDPTGIRRMLTFGQIEPLVYKKKLPLLDILNERRAPWIDPTNAAVKHDESVWMLWDKAMEDGMQTVGAVLKWLHEEELGSDKLESGQADKLRKAAAEYIGNHSYETGLPCESGAAIRFADSIWPDGGLNMLEEPSSTAG